MGANFTAVTIAIGLILGTILSIHSNHNKECISNRLSRFNEKLNEILTLNLFQAFIVVIITHNFESFPWINEIPVIIWGRTHIPI